MSNKLLMTSQQIVASVFADEDIEVVFSDQGPKADLKKRIMYLRPLPDVMKEVDIETIRGDCDHELGHFLHTDPAVFDLIKCPFDRLIFNAVEDGRIERLVSDRWYGCAVNLENSGNRAIARILRKCDSSDESTRVKAIIGLTLLTFGQSRSDVVKRLGKEIERYLSVVETELASIPLLVDSFDALDMAKSIASKWLYSMEGEGTVDRQDKKSVESLTDSMKLGDFSESRKAIIKNKKFPKRGRYIAKTDDDEIVKIVPSSNAIMGSEKFLSGLNEIVPILRRKMLIDYAGARYKDVRYQKKGKIDQRALHRVAVGDDRLFMRRHVRPDVNMEFTLLIDCSGSMTVSENDKEGAIDRLRLAGQCAAALSSTLDLMRIRNECLGFTTVSADSVPPVDGYDRVRPVRHLIIKDRNVPFQQCRYNFSELAYFDEAYENIDGEALLWAAQRSYAGSDRMAKRVIVVFSDGVPASVPESRSTLSSHLKSVIKRVEASDALLIGIGIESNHVKKFYENYLVCQDLRVFAEVFFEAYRRLLRKMPMKQA